jgi:TPR repeat protein
MLAATDAPPPGRLPRRGGQAATLGAKMLIVMALAAGDAVQAAPNAGDAGLPSRAAPLTPALRARVDAAVALYEAGRRAEAARVFAALARQGVPAAQFNLGVMHLKRELPGATPAEAERWLMLAARGGFVTAMFTLGRALEGGELGRVDLAAAHDWYEVAAERGSVDAMVAIGTAFYLGRGRAHDAVRAAGWYREAARGGDVGAQYLIASMYESGDGVAQDLRLALYWYREAARRGDEAAPGKVHEIERRLESDAERPGHDAANVDRR